MRSGSWLLPQPVRVHWFFDGWCQWRGRSVSHLRGAIRRVRPGPPVITTGTATFKARINHDGTITYKLSYSKLAGTGEVLFADVHFGQQQNTGGILFFLCANVATAPSQGVPPQPGPSPGTTVPGTVNVSAGTQACPPGKGTLTGTIRPADIVGAPVQGIHPGDLAAAVDVLGSGQSYAQIRTKLFTPGEVRWRTKERTKTNQFPWFQC